VVSCRVELGAVGNDSVFQETPQCNREAQGDRDDRDASRAAIRAGASRALVEPPRQRTVGLVSQPAPGRLDKLASYASVSLFADALIDTALTAVVLLRHESHACTKLATVVELAPEQFKHEASCSNVADTLSRLR